MGKKNNVSKLLIRLGEYLGFSALCGWISFLFFLWSSKVISDNYALHTNTTIPVQMDGWFTLVCVVAGSLIAIFVLFLLLQRKLSYILKIQSIVEEMEAGHLELEIPLEGEDELTDLAVCINHLAKAMSSNIQQAEVATNDRLETLASLSHDLRTPLTSVMSYLQFIRDGQYRDETQLLNYVERAYTKAEHIKDLSDHLFDYCKNDVSSPLNRVEGSSLLQNILTEAKVYLIDHKYQVQISSSIDDSVFYLMIDLKQITRLFENMISNIEKYADSAYPILFSLEIQKQTVILKQSNEMLDKHLTKEVESHLIGLKSIQQGLNRMKGSLSVKNEPPSFTLEIRLPIC